MEQRRAVIDIGTNSVKLLVADVSGETITPIHEHGEQTRLGRGFYETHRLSSDAIQLTARVVGQMREEAGKLGAVTVTAFATSAARDSKNPQDLVAAVHAGSGLKLQIISGEQEAAWVLAGATANQSLKDQFITLVDVGGGSTEFILGHDAQCHFSHSFKMGTVRLIEALPHSDPPTSVQLATYRKQVSCFLQAEVAPCIDAALSSSPPLTSSHELRLVGCGGTATILAMLDQQMAAFDRDRIESKPLRLSQVTHWVETLWHLPLMERRALPGLPPPRADVMLAGAVIFEAIMRELQFGELHISTRGLRFGALLAGSAERPGNGGTAA